MLTIKQINTESEELDIIRKLFQQYSSELNEDLCFQRFDEELNDPLKKYGGQHGVLLLAYQNNQPAGCVALQSLKDQNTCEMKRLYVLPEFRKHGLAAELVQAILAKATEKGFTKMVLDTLQRLKPAIRLYKKFGFENTSPYYQNPLQKVVYLQKDLVQV